jgi:hypothetical protein
MNDDQDTQTPAVSWRELLPELIALFIAVVIPPIFLVFDIADRKPDLFQRGGQIALFIVAVLQFKGLSDLNRKHIRNARRAKRGLPVWGISAARTDLGWLTLLVAIYASAISAFGDKFVWALLKIFCTN